MLTCDYHETTSVHKPLKNQKDEINKCCSNVLDEILNIAQEKNLLSDEDLDAYILIQDEHMGLIYSY